MRNVQRWADIANSYEMDLNDKEIQPQEVGKYARQILSLLSDTQEQGARLVGSSFAESGVNDSINAAKMMLSRLIEAYELP